MLEFSRSLVLGFLEIPANRDGAEQTHKCSERLNQEEAVGCGAEVCKGKVKGQGLWVVFVMALLGNSNFCENMGNCRRTGLMAPSFGEKPATMMSLLLTSRTSRGAEGLCGFV